jgi:ABC-2 type transport system permease protein
MHIGLAFLELTVLVVILFAIALHLLKTGKRLRA